MAGNAIADFGVQALSTLVGALSAFGLEAWRQERAERRRHAAALRKGIFILIKQRDLMVNLKEQFLEPLRTEKYRAFRLKPVTADPPESLRIDPSELDFLLSDGEGELLNQMMDADLKFESIVQAIQQRNTVHLRFQESLGRLPANVPDDADDEMICTLTAGRHTVLQLKNLTDEVYDYVDRTMPVNQSTSTKVELAFRRLFPKEKNFTFKYLR